MTEPVGARILIGSATTALFVPGDRPERFSKALATSADIVIIDLEDAVPENHKAIALDNSRSVLSTDAGDSLIHAVVRVNTGEQSSELSAMMSLAVEEGSGLLGIMIPKTEKAADIPDNLGDIPVIALIETARGVENLLDIARHPSVTRLAFGAVDYSSDVGSAHDTVVDYARARLVIASRAAGLPAPLDSPSTDIADVDKVRAAAENAYAMGFGGKLCIHPTQVPIVSTAFVPSDSDIQWARAVLEVGDGAHSVGGVMVDKPVLARARAILDRVSR